MSVRVIVLGAGGLVGARLTQRLVDMKEFSVGPSQKAPISKIVLFDMRDPTAVPESTRADPRVEIQLGDLTDRATMDKILKVSFGATAPPRGLFFCRAAFSALTLPISPQPEAGDEHVTCIHLAALLSGYAEDDFDLGMKVNLHGTINVMEAVRALRDQLGGRPQKYVYVSTDYVACFNEYNRTHPVTEESFRLSPVSYGVQKACNELLLCDYTRKGFLDGRVGRLSAVIGRPGWSNSISYPYTGIFTQPLEGKDYEVPLPMDVRFRGRGASLGVFTNGLPCP